MSSQQGHIKELTNKMSADLDEMRNTFFYALGAKAIVPDADAVDLIVSLARARNLAKKISNKSE